MKTRVIFVGNMKEEPIHVVENNIITRRYHKVDRQLMEYGCIETYEQLKRIKVHYSSMLLCMERLEDVKSEYAKGRCKGVLYIPELKDWNLDILFSFIKKGSEEAEEGIGMAFKGDTLGKVIMNMLIHFGLVEYETSYHVHLGVKKKIETEELCRMEDIIKEYIPLGSKLYIEQTLLKNVEEKYYFLLFV